MARGCDANACYVSARPLGGGASRGSSLPVVRRRVHMALWRGSACAGFLALAVGCVFLLEPELPGSALRSLWSSLRLGPAPVFPGPASPEGRLAAAWDALIVQPARRWRRVAVG